MSKKTECLAVLGLPDDANETAIRQAYKDLLQVWHVDRFSHNQRLKEMAEAKLKEIDDAYEYLISGGVRDPVELPKLQSQPPTPATNEWSNAEASPVDEKSSGTKTPLLVGIALLLALLFAGGFWWLGRNSKPATAKIEPAKASTSAAKAPAPSTSTGPVRSSGQEGIPRRLPEAYFKPVLMDTGVVDIAAGYGFALYLKRNQTLWGMRTPFGRTEIPDSNLYKPVLIAQNVAGLSSGGISASLITTDNELWAWTRQDHPPFTDSRFDGITHNKIQSVAKDVRATYEANTHRLFIDQGGKLWGMGYNTYGQLALNGLDLKRVPQIVATNVREAAVGKDFSLFIRDDQTLWGMGRNDSGQLGDGTLDNRDQPVLIAQRVKSVSAGYSSAVYVTDDGTLWGMGFNAGGQLTKLGISQAIPKPIEMAQGVLLAVAGRRDPETPFGTDQTLYLKSDRTLWSRGNFQSQDIFVDSDVVKVANSMVSPVFLKHDGTLWWLPNLVTSNEVAAASTRRFIPQTSSRQIPPAAKVTPQTEAKLRADLICHLKFDGNALDSSGRNYHGKNVSTWLAVDRFGKQGGAFRFDGERSYVSLDPRINPQVFTISAWIMTDQSQVKEGRAIVSKIYSDLSKQHDRRNFEMRLDANNLVVMEVPDGRNWNSIRHRHPFVPQTWHHIVMTHDGKVSRFYIDGQKVGQDLSGDYASSSSVAMVGARPLNDGKRNFHFNGHIDDVRIYSRALSASDLNLLYQMEFLGN